MMFPRMLPLIAAASILAACESGETVSKRVCDPQAHQALVGKNIGEVTLPRELPQRVISPGDMVTEDYNPARLNIFVDAKGWIGRISCG
ncbi:I78 family peptidase inhibitor [Paracoccus alkanivorans]|uniref:Peptidase inhibitor I78 family protein n=1 Tax=Paracoccus alkanivorans TaxID=2116655 RepID=A0A3M0MFM2_9RHOB|nr:I78 family peptidase inhibitor [Paracoccus alkanivorans]RMC36359.1 hypothetical protein C9E81_06720 [Paracoccus alkanivorans]